MVALIVVLSVVFLIFMVMLYFFCFTFVRLNIGNFDDVNDPCNRVLGEYKEIVGKGIERINSTPCKWVETYSFDKLCLKARYFDNGQKNTMIFFHGYRSSSSRDFSCALKMYMDLGFNVLLVDQRAHGRSEGTVITFGVKERYDCLSWIQFANQRFGYHIPIVISGLSMGAATVLMATSLDLPENVVGIMADCPYSSPAEIIRKVARDLKIPDAPVYPFIKLSAKLFGKFDLEGCTAENAVRHAKIPILLLHGEEDSFVPCDMSRKIAAACASHCELHTFPEAGHGLCYTIDADRYESAVVHFMNSIPQLKNHISNNAFSREILERSL